MQLSVAKNNNYKPAAGRIPAQISMGKARSPISREKREKVEPARFGYCVRKLTALGFELTTRNTREISFTYKGSTVVLYPFTGWFTGKTVKDGRGIDNLVNQLKNG